MNHIFALVKRSKNKTIQLIPLPSWHISSTPHNIKSPCSPAFYDTVSTGILCLITMFNHIRYLSSLLLSAFLLIQQPGRHFCHASIGPCMIRNQQNYCQSLATVSLHLSAHAEVSVPVSELPALPPAASHLPAPVPHRSAQTASALPPLRPHRPYWIPLPAVV